MVPDFFNGLLGEVASHPSKLLSRQSSWQAEKAEELVQRDNQPTHQFGKAITDLISLHCQTVSERILLGTVMV